MLEVGSLWAERFEVTKSEKWVWPEGLDRESDAAVTFIPVARHCFLDVASIDAQARVVRELNDDGLVPPLCVDPLVVPHSEGVKLKKAPLAAAALELLGVLLRARSHGIDVSPELAWVSDEGVRVPAPSAPPGLHHTSWHRHDPYLWGVRTWLDRRLGRFSKGWLSDLDTTEMGPFVETLAKRAGVPAPSFDDAPARGEVDAPMDFDRAIEDGERGVQRAEQGGQGMPDAAQWLTYGKPALAAALHHRACTRWAAGDGAGAIEDVSRAIELDPYARYLTTAALFADAKQAGPLHDRAVAALPPPTEFDHGIALIGGGRDSPEREARDAARTLTARGVYRARRGDAEGARKDLEASMIRHPTPTTARWLAAL